MNPRSDTMRLVLKRYRVQRHNVLGGVINEYHWAA
jgi:hypothetical protein